MSTTSTELTPTARAVKGALAKGKASLSDIIVAARGAVLAASRAEVDWRPERPVPVLELTEAEQDAITALLQVIEDVRLPSSARKMEPKEISDVVRLKAAAEKAGKAVEKATLAAKVAFFNHADEVATEKGQVDDTTPITKEGWFVIEDKISGAVPGEGQKPVREVRSGSVTLAAEDLKALVDSGDLDHADYLALTRQVRVLDEARLHEVIDRKPHLAEVIDKAVKVGSPQASFTLRANK